MTVLNSSIDGNSRLGINTLQTGQITVEATAVSNNLDGGILGWFGPVVVVDSIISNNGSAVSSAGGISAYSDVTLLRSIISGNRSPEGAGIWTRGSVAITDSAVLQNQAFVGPAGGILMATLGDPASRTLILTNSLVSSNTSTARGGGIYTRVITTITDSMISGNHSDELGGGIFGSVESRITVVGSTIDGNSAGGFRQAGAGIFSVGDVAVENSTISNNNRDNATQATFGGIVGRNVVLKQATISGNGRGGVSANSITATHSTVTANTGTGLSGNNVLLSHTIVAEISSRTSMKATFNLRL